jgi:predicted ArsR family transcriptional regulator
VEEGSLAEEGTAEEPSERRVRQRTANPTHNPAAAAASSDGRAFLSMYVDVIDKLRQTIGTELLEQVGPGAVRATYDDVTADMSEEAKAAPEAVDKIVDLMIGMMFAY